ncbi:MAG: hypothetical protein PHD76_01565 [Methylacidiphilales bacterium]|nr:hypothetical protein [Candidatus Methylacidiphilales bacterium]
MEAPKSGLRAFQDRMANAGWCIQLIPYDDPSKPMRVQTNLYALVGVLVFLGGFLLFLQKHDRIYLCVAVVALGLACLGLLFVGRSKRRGWQRLNAVCIDREHKRCHRIGGGAASGGYTWAFRLLCKFEFEGTEYSVTPGFWRSFASEKGLLRFLEKTINGDGICALYVNPQNPLQTEFSGGDLADWLLH